MSDLWAIQSCGKDLAKNTDVPVARKVIPFECIQWIIGIALI